VVKLTDTSVMLEWHVPDNNGLPVTFFKVQYKELVTDKQRRRWRTIDEDIPSHVRQFELMALKPGLLFYSCDMVVVCVCVCVCVCARETERE